MTSLLVSFQFQEKLVEMVVNTVEYIDKTAYTLMRSIGENVSICTSKVNFIKVGL